MKKQFPKGSYKEEVYTDQDEDSGAYGVFGIDTGHCYASFMDGKEAEEKAKDINEQRNKCNEKQ